MSLGEPNFKENKYLIREINKHLCLHYILNKVISMGTDVSHIESTQRKPRGILSEHHEHAELILPW